MGENSQKHGVKCVVFIWHISNQLLADFSNEEEMSLIIPLNLDNYSLGVFEEVTVSTVVTDFNTCWEAIMLGPLTSQNGR